MMKGKVRSRIIDRKKRIHCKNTMCTMLYYIKCIDNYMYFFIIYILLGQFFAMKSKIKNIVFLINLKAKKVFFKVLSRFKKFFRSKKFKNQFLGLKNFFRFKNQLLGLKSQINNRQGDFC